MNIYDRAGKAITKEEWAALLGDTEGGEKDARRVEHDRLDDGTEISTVWLGLDHAWGHGPPLIFETMIFGGEHDEDMWRYSTEDEARRGHARVVDELKAGRKPRASTNSRTHCPIAWKRSTR